MRRLASRAHPVGIAVIVFGLGELHARTRGTPYRFGTQNSLWAYGFLALALIVCSYALGIPDQFENRREALFASALAGIVGTGAAAVAQTLRPNLLPRYILIAAPITVAAWNYVISAFVTRATVSSRRDRVLAIISGTDAEVFRVDATDEFPVPERAFQIVDVVQLDAEDVDRSGAAARLGPVVRDRAAAAQPTVIVVNELGQSNDAIVEELVRLHASGVRVRTLSDFYDEWLGKLPLTELGRMAMLFDIRDLHHLRFRKFKRLFDVIVASVGLLAIPIVVPVVLVGNAFANRGPMFFRQPRVGRDGTVFTIFKLRTMRPESLDQRMAWTSPADPRITVFGRMLRRTHIDELPQIWNVLRGDLSIVGPRPEQPHFVDELEQKLPFFGLRHLVQPGITGWAQVKFSYAASEADAVQKLQYDLYYLRHQSLTFDLRIIGRTIRSVVGGKGR